MSFRNKPRFIIKRPMDDNFYQWLRNHYDDPHLERNIQLLKMRNEGHDYYAIAHRFELAPHWCGVIYKRYSTIFDTLYKVLA